MMDTSPEELVKLRKKHTFKYIAKVTGLTENAVKKRIYKFENREARATIKSKACNLSTAQKERASALHYFGHPAHEIATEIEAKSGDVRIYVADLPKHPSFKKKTA